jgi:hypothetical protein
MKKISVISACLLCALLPLAAQTGFGFDDLLQKATDPNAVIEAEPADTAVSGFALPAVNISGEVKAQLLAFGDDFSSTSRIKSAQLGDIFSGKLNFSASGSRADAVINLNLSPVFDGVSSPVGIDEAYIRGYFGSNVNLEGGLRKLTWGKADSFGPLDVINPLDYSDLTDMTDLMGRKIARPLIHGTYTIGSFSKLEGVFVPAYEGHRFASEGRWVPSQFSPFEVKPGKIDVPYPSDLPELKYFQGGLRFTTTVGSSDIGFQGYLGRLHRPAVSFKIEKSTDPDDPLPTIAPVIEYNLFGQIGADYAQVLGGFNVRAELAANITKDLKGDDGTIYNPFIGWSLGFDRDVVWAINANVQATGSIRLMDDKVGTGEGVLVDAEEGKDVSSTRIIVILSRKFLRDELEVKLTGLWGIEDKDFLILPGIVWTKSDLAVELSAGIFAGDHSGEMGQYYKNSFIKACMTYTF